MASSTIYTIPPLLSSILFLVLGLYVYLNRKSFVNTAFLFVCLATSWWQLSWFFLFNVKDEVVAGLLVKVGYAGIIFIPIFFLHFFLSFLKNESKFDRYFLYFSYVAGIVFEVFLFKTSYFIKGFYKYFWGFYPKAGLLHPVYLLLLAAISVRIVYLLISFLQKNRNARSVKYYQVKYLLFALIFYIFASSDFLVNYGMEFYPIGFLFILFFLGITAYAIVRYRLMDITVAVGRAVAFLFSFFTALLAAFMIVFVSSLIVSVFQLSLLILLFSFAVFCLHKLYENLVEIYFYPAFYGRKVILSNLEEEVQGLLGMKDFSGLITKTLQKAFGLKKIAVFVRRTGDSGFKTQKNLGFRKEQVAKLLNDKPFLGLLEKMKTPLGMQEILLLLEKEKKNTLIRIKDKMKESNVEIVIPLFFESKIIGVIVLGERLSKEAFSKEEVNLLASFSKQASISLRNTLLYSEVKNRKEDLERFYRLTVEKEIEIAKLKKENLKLKDKIKKEK